MTVYKELSWWPGESCQAPLYHFLVSGAHNHVHHFPLPCTLLCLLLLSLQTSLPQLLPWIYFVICRASIYTMWSGFSRFQLCGSVSKVRQKCHGTRARSEWGSGPLIPLLCGSYSTGFPSKSRRCWLKQEGKLIGCEILLQVLNLFRSAGSMLSQAPFLMLTKMGGGEQGLRLISIS